MRDTLILLALIAGVAWGISSMASCTQNRDTQDAQYRTLKCEKTGKCT